MLVQVKIWLLNIWLFLHVWYADCHFTVTFSSLVNWLNGEGSCINLIVAHLEYKFPCYTWNFSVHYNFDISPQLTLKPVYILIPFYFKMFNFPFMLRSSKPSIPVTLYEQIFLCISDILHMLLAPSILSCLTFLIIFDEWCKLLV